MCCPLSQGGTIMHSEGALVANRRALLERKVGGWVWPQLWRVF